MDGSLEAIGGHVYHRIYQYRIKKKQAVDNKARLAPILQLVFTKFESLFVYCYLL